MNAVGGSDIRIATAGEIEEMMGENGFEAEKGFIGPQGLKLLLLLMKQLKI